GGMLLTLGFMTPLGGAAVVAVMVNAIGAVHWPNGLWVTDGGYEFPLVMATVASALAFAGAGDVSLDGAIGWDLSGGAWGVAAIAAGIIAGALTLTMRRPAPAPAVTGEAQATIERERERTE